MSGGVQLSPASTARMALPIMSTSSDFGMKPEAPNSMARRITVASSVAETMTTGTSGCWARSAMSPENP